MGVKIVAPMRGALFLVSTVAVTILLVACGGAGTPSGAKLLDVRKAQREVAGEVEPDNTPLATVSCPGKVRDEPGVRFGCTVIYPEGAHPEVVVEIIDGSGHVKLVRSRRSASGAGAPDSN